MELNNAQDYFLDYVNNFLTIEKFAEFHKFSMKQAENIIERGRKMNNKVMKAKRKQDHIFKLQKMGMIIDFDDLKKIEKRAHKLAEDCCNFLSIESVSFQRREKRLINDVKNAFGGTLPEGFKLNLDPRGYALKIDFEQCPKNKDMLNIETDFGGYGILVPEFK